MADLFSNLSYALIAILRWDVFLAIPLGVLTGIIVGAVPGLTVTMAVALLTPFTFFLDPVLGIVFLLALYKGGIYGGTITAIILSTPGTPASAASVADGSALTAKGQPGKALNLALYTSVIADTLSDLVLILVAAPLALVALRFGPPEMFALLLFALTIIGTVTGRSFLKGLLAATLGLLIAVIGLDPIQGSPRLTFGVFELSVGFNLIPLLLGLFGFSELLLQAERSSSLAKVKAITTDIRDRLSWREFRSVIRHIIKSTFIGTFIGALPGMGAPVASFIAYGEAQRSARKPERFGKGSLEGLAAAEAGNSAVTGATMIPMLTFGIPGDAVTAILLVAFIAQGLRPGPQLITEHAHVLYMILAGLILSNLGMLIVGKLAITYLYKPITRIPPNYIFPVVAALLFIGTYSVNNHVFDLYVLVGAGLLGFGMRKFGFPLPPLVIAFLLGQMFEMSFRQSLMLSRGDPMIFFNRPLSLTFILLAIAMAVFVRIVVYGVSARAKQALQETEGDNE